MTRAGTTRRARPGGRVACGVLALAAGTLLAACRSAAPQLAGPPATWRVDTVTYEVALADAERLWLPAHEREPALSVGFDADGALERAVKSLAAAQPDVRVRAWNTAHVANEAWGELAPRDADLARELDVSVCPMWRDSWTPLALEVAVDWRDARGERIAQLPSSAQPVPPGVAVRVVCLPARTRDAGVRPIARFTFVRTTPDVHAP